MAKKKKDKMITRTYYIPESMYEWLRETAFYERRDMSELVREALEQYKMFRGGGGHGGK
jgi:hypothetical protein